MTRREQEAALEKELRFHIEERVRDLMQSGMPEQEARRRVRLEFGGMEQVQEQCRDVRRGRRWERWAKDFQYALRTLRKSPGAAATMILTVTVCVAVNTGVFTVVDSLLLRPLPFEDADRLVAMTNLYPKAGMIDQDGSAAGDYIDRDGTLPAIREQALYRFVTHPVDRGGTPNQMRGLAVTPSFLPLLRVRPALGRQFTENEGVIGKHRVVILTEAARREMFGDGEVLGQQVRISGQPYTVAGVLPRAFRFMAADVRYLIPIALTDEEKRGRHANGYRYLARLRDGATVQEAQSQVDALNAQLLERLPTLKELLVNAGFRTHVKELQPFVVRKIRNSLQLLWAGALLVLLVGAVNVAGLALARASSRKREMATRIALGATRGDLVRQCVLENVMPASIGGLLGAAGGVIALRLLNYDLLPGAAEIRPEAVVLLYAMCGALFAGVLAGLASLVPLRGMELARAMHDGSRGGTTRSIHLRRVFVVAQVSLAFVLLNSAGVLTASIRELWRVNPGFRIEDVWTASTYLPSANYPEGADLRAAMDRIVQGTAALGGVAIAGGGSAAPFADDYDDNVVMAEGYVMKPGESAISPVRLRITPGYLETFGIQLVQGRVFDARDRSDAARVVMVDERLAARFWPGQNPVGRRMYYPGDQPKDGFIVVGVVRTVRLEDLSGAGNQNGVYYIPWAQGPARAMTIAWRGRAESVAALRSEFARLVPGAALFDVRSMEERQELTLAARRAAQAMVLVFAGVAVLLTAIGVNGLLAFLVTQRRREIGIRMAIGCRPAGVYGMFLREGLVLVSIGLVVGFGAATALRPWIANQLYGVGALEPAVLAVVLGLIAGISMTAISFPAWRAARVDPVSVLGEA